MLLLLWWGVAERGLEQGRSGDGSVGLRTPNTPPRLPPDKLWRAGIAARHKIRCDLGACPWPKPPNPRDKREGSPQTSSQSAQVEISIQTSLQATFPITSASIASRSGSEPTYTTVDINNDKHMPSYRSSSRVSSSTPVPVQTSRHRGCLVYGCRNRTCCVKEAGRKIYSQYCYEHTCFRTVPIRDGYHCPMAKAEGARYCENHMACGADNCRELGENPDGSYPWYCNQRTPPAQDSLPDCKLTLSTDRCGETNCVLEAKNFLTMRCTSHQRCAALQCNNPPSDELHSNFCTKHTCTREDCPLQAVAHNRCRDHSRCQVSACTETRLAKQNGRLEPYCRVHMASKCAHLGCRGRKLNPNQRYCLDHGCRLPSCSNERYEGGGTLCHVHKCAFDDCFDVIAKPNDNRSLFCINHACRVDACLYSKRHSGGLCKDHTCVMAGCHRVVTEGNRCKVHAAQEERPACRVDNCRNSAGKYGYCEGRHACVKDGCWQARLSVKLGSRGSDWCLKHDREQRRTGKTSDWDSGSETLEKKSWKRKQATVEDAEDVDDY